MGAGANVRTPLAGEAGGGKTGAAPWELNGSAVVLPLASNQGEAGRRGKQQPDRKLARINQAITILGFVDILEAAG